MAATDRVRLATIEKLMVQVFEKKSRIIDQVKQQTRLFDQHLASKLLIDGIAPPPWLLPPDLPTRTSDAAELNAEDLISEVLLSHRLSAIPFSRIGHSVYEKPVAEGTNGQLLNGLCTEEVCAENKDFYEGDKPCSNAGCASVGVSKLDHCIAVPQDQREEDPTMASPLEQRDTRISDVNHDLALSLARLQRSKSRQRALELRNSAKEETCRLEDSNNLSGCSRGINGSVVPFLRVEQLGEMNSVESLDTTDDIGPAEDVKLGDTWSKEKGGRIDFRVDTRFRSSGLKQSSSNVGNISNVIREDGAMFTDSVGPSIQQSNHGNQPLEPVSNSLIGDQNYWKTEPKVGNKRSKEKGSNTDFMRITRSKRYTEQDSHVTDPFELGGSCDNHKECGTSNLTQQAQLFDRVPIIKFADVIKASAGTKVGTHDYSGRITRSRSSRQPCNTVYDLSKPVRLSPGQENQELCAVGGTQHSTKRNSAEGYILRSKGSEASPTLGRVLEPSRSSIKAHVSPEKPLAIQEDQELFAENSTDASDVENNVDSCVGRNIRTKPSFTAEVTSELVSSQDLGHRVTRSRSDALCKSQESESLNSSRMIVSNVSGLDVKDLPCTSTSQPSNKEGCAATVKETEIVPLEPVEAQHARLNGDGVVGLETLGPCPDDSSMLMVPKQLNFDDVEVSRLNGMSPPAIKNENKGRLLEKTPPVLSEDAGILDKAMAESYQKNNSLSPEKRVDLSKEEKPQRDFSEVQVEEMSTATLALDEIVVSPVKETSRVGKDMVTHNPQQSDKNSKERSSLTGSLFTTKAAWKIMPGSLLKVVTISSLSDVNAHTGMDPSPEVETETLVEAKVTELVTKDSDLEAFSVDQELSKDADFPLVTKPDPCVNQEACTDHEVELPYAVSKDSMGNLVHPTVDSEMPQSHIVEPLVRSSHKDTSVERSQSTQLQVTTKSGAKSSSVDGSRNRNKRKRSKLSDTLSHSHGTKENTILSVNKDCKSRDVLNEEHGPKVILESRDLQGSQEHVTPLVISRSQVEELHQIEKHNITEDSISSPKLKIEMADFSLEESDRNANTSLAFANEEQGAFLVPTEVRHAAEDSKSHLIQETRNAGPAMIIYDGEWQCSLQENGNSYQLEDKFETKNFERLTTGEALVLEEKADLVETSKFSYCSDVMPHSPSFYLTRADETIPVLERFVMPSDDEQPCKADEEISFDRLAIERASILEQLCKSACMQTPVSCSSASCKLKYSNLYVSVPTGLLEGMDMRDKLPISEEVSHPSHARTHSDCLSSTATYSDGDVKRLCTSPVQKVWDRIIKSGSSEKRRILNPELPCINEENENLDDVADASQEGIGLEMPTGSVKREPLAEIDANLAISEAESCDYRFSIESVNTGFSFNGTHNRAKKNPGNGSTQRRYNNKENAALGAASLKRIPRPLHNSFTKPKLSAKTNSRKGGLSITETETKRCNIVSNIASFIPLVQQKQAPAVVTGKRDVKVTALEAAEAAKRAAEKKENERKLKKEAMKLERARQREEEELQKKKKEEDRKKKEADMAAKKRQREEEAKKEKERKDEERKKKEADMAAKKRQREEEEKKERERKRLRIEELRKQQKEHEQKLQAAKDEKMVKGHNTDQKGHETVESKDKTRNYTMEKGKRDDNCLSISEAEPRTTQASTSDDTKSGIVQKDCEALSDVGIGFKGQVSSVNNLDKATRTENLVATTRQEQSYDISPYKGSDDEDEDTPSGKFVPSWASKNRVALAVFSQDGVDPATIFPPESFCGKAEVLLSLRLK